MNMEKKSQDNENSHIDSDNTWKDDINNSNSLQNENSNAFDNKQEINDISIKDDTDTRNDNNDQSDPNITHITEVTTDDSVKPTPNFVCENPKYIKSHQIQDNKMNTQSTETNANRSSQNTDINQQCVCFTSDSSFIKHCNNSKDKFNNRKKFKKNLFRQKQRKSLRRKSQRIVVEITLENFNVSKKIGLTISQGNNQRLKQNPEETLNFNPHVPSEINTSGLKRKIIPYCDHNDNESCLVSCDNRCKKSRLSCEDRNENESSNNHDQSANETQKITLNISGNENKNLSVSINLNSLSDIDESKDFSTKAVNVEHYVVPSVKEYEKNTTSLEKNLPNQNAPANRGFASENNQDIDFINKSTYFTAGNNSDDDDRTEHTFVDPEDTQKMFEDAEENVEIESQSQNNQVLTAENNDQNAQDNTEIDKLSQNNMNFAAANNDDVDQIKQKFIDLENTLKKCIKDENAKDNTDIERKSQDNRDPTTENNDDVNQTKHKFYANENTQKKCKKDKNAEKNLEIERKSQNCQDISAENTDDVNRIKNLVIDGESKSHQDPTTENNNVDVDQTEHKLVDFENTQKKCGNDENAKETPEIDKKSQNNEHLTKENNDYGDQIEQKFCDPKNTQKKCKKDKNADDNTEIERNTQINRDLTIESNDDVDQIEHKLDDPENTQKKYKKDENAKENTEIERESQFNLYITAENNGNVDQIEHKFDKSENTSSTEKKYKKDGKSEENSVIEKKSEEKVIVEHMTNNKTDDINDLSGHVDVNLNKKTVVEIDTNLTTDAIKFIGIHSDMSMLKKIDPQQQNIFISASNEISDCKNILKTLDSEAENSIEQNRASTSIQSSERVDSPILLKKDFKEHSFTDGFVESLSRSINLLEMNDESEVPNNLPLKASLSEDVMPSNIKSHLERSSNALVVITRNDNVVNERNMAENMGLESATNRKRKCTDFFCNISRADSGYYCSGCNTDDNSTSQPQNIGLEAIELPKHSNIEASNVCYADMSDTEILDSDSNTNKTNNPESSVFNILYMDTGNAKTTFCSVEQDLNNKQNIVTEHIDSNEIKNKNNSEKEELSDNDSNLKVENVSEKKNIDSFNVIDLPQSVNLFNVGLLNVEPNIDKQSSNTHIEMSETENLKPDSRTEAKTNETNNPESSISTILDMETLNAKTTCRLVEQDLNNKHDNGTEHIDSNEIKVDKNKTNLVKEELSDKDSNLKVENVSAKKNINSFDGIDLPQSVNLFSIGISNVETNIDKPSANTHIEMSETENLKPDSSNEAKTNETNNPESSISTILAMETVNAKTTFSNKHDNGTEHIDSNEIKVDENKVKSEKEDLSVRHSNLNVENVLEEKNLDSFDVINLPQSVNLFNIGLSNVETSNTYTEMSETEKLKPDSITNAKTNETNNPESSITNIPNVTDEISTSPNKNDNIKTSEYPKITRNDSVIKDILQSFNCLTETRSNIISNGTVYELEELSSSNSKFSSLKSTFNLSMKHAKSVECKKYEVEKIEKINCPYLVAQFVIKGEKKRTKGKMVGGQTVYHGTQKKNIPLICKNNFDWRKSGTHKGTKFGKGISFAKHPTYATYYPKCYENPRAMIVTKIWIVNKQTGTNNMTVPDEGYDTSINENGDVIVKYDDAEFLPMYVIYYNTGIHETLSDLSNDDDDDDDYWYLSDDDF